MLSSEIPQQLVHSWDLTIAYGSYIKSGPSPGFSSRGGQKPEGGATYLKHSIGCMQQPGGQTWNGGHRFQMGGPGTTGPSLATDLHKAMLLALLGSSGMQRRRQQVAIRNDTPLRPVVCLHIWGVQEEYHLAHVQCHSISCWYLREPPPARLLHLDYQDWTVWSGDYKKRRFLRKSKGFWQTLKR